MRSVKLIPVFTGMTISNSSSYSTKKIWVGDYEQVALLVRCASHSSGNGAFTVKAGFGQIASDDPTMTAFNMLVDNVTNTNSQTLTRVNGKTLSANGDAMLWVAEDTPVTHLEVDLAITTDGTYSAWLVGFCD
jgi:hypothetical protein